MVGRRIGGAAAAVLALVMSAEAGPASGAFTLQKGAAISPKHATAYIVRDQRDAREKRVEILLTEVAIAAGPLQSALAPHMMAINLDALRDRNYILLWVRPDGSVTMNATFGATMTQFINDTSDGLTAELTANTPARIAGRLTSAASLKTPDGKGYSLDVTFSVDVPPASEGTPLPAGGGEAGRAFAALMASAEKKDWAALKAASSPALLKILEADYRTPAENAEYALDMLQAWIPQAKRTIAAGELRGDDVAILDVEGEMFPGMRGLTLVRMVKRAATWQLDEAQRMGFLP